VRRGDIVLCESKVISLNSSDIRQYRHTWIRSLPNKERKQDIQENPKRDLKE
jgi:hypothetical protein